MKEEKLIYIKINYEDGIDSKRDILNSEAGMIKILQTIKKYHLLRDKELEKKEKLKKIEANLKINIAKINLTFPKIKVPKILQKEIISEENPVEIDIPREIKIEHNKEVQDELSIQLEEIQEKLKKLSAR